MDTNVSGSLIVSDDVLADLVGYAAKECYGVVGMALPPDASMQDSIAGLRPSTRLRRGIIIEHGEDGRLSVELHVILEYGVNMSTVSQNLVDSVRFVLKDIAQIEDPDVTVHVEGVKVRQQ